VFGIAAEQIKCVRDHRQNRSQRLGRTTGAAGQVDYERIAYHTCDRSR
jgi:hypothetical protein